MSIGSNTPASLGSSHTTQPLFSFGVIADVQYAEREPKRTRHYCASLRKLARSVEVFNTKPLAFVIQLGDLIDRDFASFKTPMHLYNQLDMPHYHVLGNHDFSVPQPQKRQVLQVFGLQQGYYDFTLQRWRFIVLDGNDISLYAWPKDSPQYTQAETMLHQLKSQQALNAKPYNGAVSEERLAWLKRELDDASHLQQRVVLFCHFPIFPSIN